MSEKYCQILKTETLGNQEFLNKLSYISNATSTMGTVFELKNDTHHIFNLSTLF